MVWVVARLLGVSGVSEMKVILRLRMSHGLGAVGTRSARR
jgi:hypothetical protein